MKNILITLILLFSTPALAGPEILTQAELVVEAPLTCDVGELVRFDATKSTVNLKWEIIPKTKDFEVVDGGKRAFFSGRRPGTFRVIVAGAKNGEPFLWHQELTVRGTIGPTVETLESKIKDWLTLVDTPNKIEEAKKIASVFKTLSTTEIEVEKILEATAVANREVLSGSLQAWIPFLEALGNELDAYSQQSQLQTREQYTKVWSEIANGILEGIK